MPEVKDSRPLKSESPAAGMNDRQLVPGVCIFLAAIVWLVFGQTLGHEFVNFDDGAYVYENPVVQKGLTMQGIVLAFTRVYSFNWHPLTMMSHMLDCQLYGLNAGGHHLTNVLLHTASVILLFLVLRQMTGFLWRSAFVAAVFAIHPLRAESVAWVSERKDVLSGLFFMLTLWAYTRYAQGRSRVEGRESSTQVVPALDPRLWTLDYWLVLLFFVLGLLCKPMLVTLPLMLLLLDYWPLGRVTGYKWQVTNEKKEKPSTLSPQPSTTKQLSTLLLEKLPLFGLAVASCVVTIFAQHEAVASFEKFSLPLRLGNAVVSGVAYLGQMFWPAGLAVLYPFKTRAGGVSGVVLSLVLLAVISAGVFFLRRRRPYFLAGWLWYLIMLAPVIGIFQVGTQARADRYTYLPQIGLYLLLTWGAAEWYAGWRHRRAVLGSLATVILAALIFRARAQTACWRNSETLWTHTIACTSGNAIAHVNLGNFLFQKGRVDEAITQYQAALQIRPDYAAAHNNLGNALRQEGRLDEAMVHFQKALEINPNYAKAHYNLGVALAQKGLVDQATVQFRKALESQPDNAEACYNLGNALIQKGNVSEAVTFYQEALQIKPDYVYVLNNLAWLLATSPDAHIRDGVQAVQYAGRACELTHYAVAPLLCTLAAAYAEAGRYDDAIAAAQNACALASGAGETELLEKTQRMLVLYQAHQPYHEAAGKINFK
jgi:Flp pilus assembly protein TadD